MDGVNVATSKRAVTWTYESVKEWSMPLWSLNLDWHC